MLCYREVFDVPLNSLPPYEITNINCCDVCVDEKLGNEPAVSHCTTCDKTYCHNHLEVLFTGCGYTHTVQKEGYK